MTLANLAITSVAACFAFMAAVALLAPHRIVKLFGIEALSIAGRNEVRAVYGGFGIAMTAALILALVSPELRQGLCIAIAFALYGMAGGRVVSIVVDRALPRFVGLCLAIECAGASALIYAHTG